MIFFPARRLAFFCIALLMSINCLLLFGNEFVINQDEFKRMSNGQFKNISKVLTLFPKSAVDVKQRVELAIKQANIDLDTIKDLKASERTFENTARALDSAAARFFVVSNGLEVAQMVSPEKSIRDAALDAVVKLESFAVDAFLSVDLYRSFQEYVEGNAKKDSLNAEEKYYLEKKMKDFRRAGLHLPEAELDEVKRLQKDLSQLCQEFDKNIAQDKSSIRVLREGLAGTSEHFINNLEKAGDKFVVKCDYPSVNEVLKHCSVYETRQKLYRAFQNIAYPINKNILEKIIIKRDELARRLGFSSYAHFDIDNQMAKNEKRATTFINDLCTEIVPKEQAEFECLVGDLPNGVCLCDGKFEGCDLAYATQAYKKKHFVFDDREVAQYFETEKTIAGILKIYQEFLDLEFKHVKPKGVWHEDVSAIEVRRKGRSEPEGYVFLDLFPRNDKYSHACCHSVVRPVLDRSEDNHVSAVRVLITNFPKPTKDRPSLLTHGDVETFFHEFGHAMHGVLGRTGVSEFAGTRVKCDFLEVPSQMFEGWVWDKEMLKLVSSHYKTGESLPDELIEKMLELKRFDSGYWVQRQCFFSLLSLEYFNGGGKGLDSTFKRLYEKTIKHVCLDPETHDYAAFGHLVDYGAKYYSYMWSKVFALDVFDTIRENGLLDRNV
ncbi:Zn-dependent oligopeptidase, partial [Candidatus Babeliales bacterium]|nr:Zn-dependent oligopeptidase [Candidatus Babeliales bacterium]